MTDKNAIGKAAGKYAERYLARLHMSIAWLGFEEGAQWALRQAWPEHSQDKQQKTMDIPNEYLPELKAWTDGLWGDTTYLEFCRARLKELEEKRAAITDEIGKLETCVKETTARRERLERLRGLLAKEERTQEEQQP